MLLWLLLSTVVVGAAGSSCTGQENMCDSAVEKLIVKFGSAQISCNADVSGKQAADKPTVDFPSGTQGSSYVLLMVDPDASCWFHFGAVVKKSGSSLAYEKELIEYMGPSPPAGAGPHRYQFVLWPWSGSKELKVKAEKRPGFDFDEFKKSNDLGNPVAVFQFKTATPN